MSHRTIEQGWEGLSMKQHHRSNDPTDKLESTIGRTVPQMNYKVPSVERLHR